MPGNLIGNKWLREPIERSKTLDEQQRTGPRRVLSALDCTAVIAGIIIGIGIFETTPQIAGVLSTERQIVLLWLAGGLLSICGALVYAELGAAYPEQGGEYAYLREAYGPAVSFLFAWGGFLIVRPGSIAAMSFPFSRYAKRVLEEAGWQLGDAVAPVWLAIACIFVLTALNVSSVKTSTLMQHVLTSGKVLGILIFAVLLLASSSSEASATAAPSVQNDWGLALILVLFCYGGWNEIAYVGAEVRDPQRSMYRSLLWGVSAVIAAYLLITGAFLKVLGLNGVRHSTAVAADAASALWPDKGGGIVSLLICISALGALHGMVFTGARLSYALGRDHLVFGRLGVWNDRMGTPSAALWIQGLISIAVVLAAGSFTAALLYTTSVVWLFFFMTGCSVFILRKRFPDRFPSAVRSGHPWTSLVFCASALFVAIRAVQYDLSGTAVAAGILLAGLPLYRYGQQRTLRKYEERAR